MADTTNYGWTKPTVGGSEDTWGTISNTLYDDIDTDLKTVSDAVAAKQAGSANLTAWSALATSAKQDASANLTAWSAIATSTKQAASANLTTLAGVTPGATGLAILADTTGAAVRTEIGCGTIATRNLTVSTSEPTGGSDGDLWFRYTT